MPKKVMIWPDVYREQGHWLPAISLAKSLKDATYEVEFMGIEDIRPIVEAYGGKFTTIFSNIYPFGHSINDRLEPEGQRWKPHHLLPMCRGELDTVLGGSNKPDLLIVGYFNGLEGLIAHHRYDIPLATITTYLRHPDEDPAIFAKSKLVFMPDPIAEKIVELASGESEMTLDEFVEPLFESKEMIPCPRDFDFFDEDWEHDPDKTTYVEPMVKREPLGDIAPIPISQDVYHDIPDPEDPMADPPVRELIFGTSGSQVADYEDKARRFFHDLIAMMKTSGMGQYHLVLSMGEKLYEEFLVYYGVDTNESKNQLPSNVSLAVWVDQLEILPRCKAVFMHGGLATIKESIFHGAPIVIVPHGKDQGENALRITRNGVGITPKVDVLSALKLRELFLEVTTSTWVNERLGKMQGYFRAAEEDISPKPSVQLITSIVPPT